MASNVPTSSNVANPSNAVAPTNGTSPWTTTKVLVLTRYWITVYEGLPTMVSPHCLVGDEWSRLIVMFNHEVGQGQEQLKPDIVSKWMDLKNKVTWFNRGYNYEKIRRSHADDEILFEDVNECYLCEFDGNDFEYTDIWNLIQNKPFFM
ncbi:hypothetical protein Lser_V15G04427 [Lactuca serriola]